MQSLQEITAILTAYGYIGKPNYVFKKVTVLNNKVVKTEFDAYIVVMKHTPYTKTNEMRENVNDPNYAKFRASELEVVLIIDLLNYHNTPSSIKNIYWDDMHNKKIWLYYTVGKIVKPNTFDEDINIVCTSGIHYFKTIEAAYFYGRPHAQFSGIFKNWHTDGTLSGEGHMSNGVPNGLWVFWYTNGFMAKKGEYIDNKKTGLWTLWYDNGNKNSEGHYIDGNCSGIWTEWCEHDGTIKSVANYD